ncbi:protein aurora borealis [Nothoprocta perdicaria]|uniref:protein aurora borealis n=1 Tax=Nothoprocta perdicaria TaxID=30464 RepID=UPI000E1B84DC|nr:protein aurora borealis [Nothoprocta perdicaria]
MGDMKETKMQITPETPGRVAVLNPFESPSDYYTLQEQIVSSPSVFKSTKSSSTPGKFRWSIDQLALINPVEIDSEDVRRQAMYLSHARIDKEMEERRQKAIEEFFTKRLIVPSPWTEHEGKQVSQFNSTKCIDLNNISPIGRQLPLQPGKSNAACQTVLSLPVDFNLEKILGEYIRTDEFADQSQENLSSSSLRRKLFLEENGNVSECLSPSLQSPCGSQPLGVLCSIDISPVRCRSPLETSGSAQFSSSPIQGGARAYSLGSITSPPFPEGSPAHNGSPTFSPIAFHIRKTPMSGVGGTAEVPHGGGAISMDTSRMCVSPLAESSALPADGSSLQVDSGYNTQTGGSSIMDIAGIENSCRENDVSSHVFQNKSQLLRTKECSALNHKDNQLLRAKSPEKQSCFHKAKKLNIVFGQNATCNISTWQHNNENQIEGFHRNGSPVPGYWMEVVSPLQQPTEVPASERLEQGW